MIRKTLSKAGGAVWRTILIGIETTVMESCIGGERLGSTSKNTHGQVRIYSQGEVWSLPDVKLLEGNMGVRERFWLKGPNRILAESSEGHQRMAEDEKPDCISRGIMCEGRMATLTSEILAEIAQRRDEHRNPKTGSI